ncbi:MAG: hypothetical protein EO766_16340 [Hydrotalea sp. AMD]|uniref:hypothetical protein n=1 Tax=Hydrotalea sp. AMD TaxID=2501297 RepID=UPI001025FEE0|nr:hypothetical protein [Hydrotalea sp. AMD]RWZ85636.1 MAG: hypothetical protein EO766_16340 [Hydrotalea sp. AMD]
MSLNHVIRQAQWSADNSFTPWNLTTGVYQDYYFEDIDYGELSQKYRVVLDGEVDRLRLFWLINAIGETKLNRSIDKYIARYPGCFPFVSYLLKIYNKRVPTSVYAPSLIPQSVVYLLVLADNSQLKIGESNCWVKRAFSFVEPPMTVVEMLDVDKSCALPVL